MSETCQDTSGVVSFFLFFFCSCFPWASLTVGFALLIGDKASDQDWVLNLPKAKDKGALRFFSLHPLPHDLLSQPCELRT